MATQTAPFPYETPVSPETTDRGTGKKTRSPYFSQEIVDWFLGLQQRADATAQRLGSLTLTAQAASIPTTPVPMPALTEGLYRVTVYVRITQAGTISSSLTVTVTGTDGGVSCPQSAAAVTANTTATVQGTTFIVRSDASVPISYATTYATAGATAMQYRLDLRVEAL
jgi:hypothetical protein